MLLSWKFMLCKHSTEIFASLDDLISFPLISRLLFLFSLCFHHFFCITWRSFSLFRLFSPVASKQLRIFRKCLILFVSSIEREKLKYSQWGKHDKQEKKARASRDGWKENYGTPERAFNQFEFQIISSYQLYPIKLKKTEKCCLLTQKIHYKRLEFLLGKLRQLFLKYQEKSQKQDLMEKNITAQSSKTTLETCT